jgi:hypothetical protein
VELKTSYKLFVVTTTSTTMNTKTLIFVPTQGNLRGGKCFKAVRQVYPYDDNYTVGEEVGTLGCDSFLEGAKPGTEGEPTSFSYVISRSCVNGPNGLFTTEHRHYRDTDGGEKTLDKQTIGTGPEVQSMSRIQDSTGGEAKITLQNVDNVAKFQETWDSYQKGASQSGVHAVEKVHTKSPKLQEGTERWVGEMKALRAKLEQRRRQLQVETQHAKGFVRDVVGPALQITFMGVGAQSPAQLEGAGGEIILDTKQGSTKVVKLVGKPSGWYDWVFGSTPLPLSAALAAPMGVHPVSACGGNCELNHTHC